MLVASAFAARATARPFVSNEGFDTIPERTDTMNADQFQGNWKQIKGKVREKWGQLTNDDVDVINGRVDQLVGRIQEKYGMAHDAAEREVNRWLQSDDLLEEPGLS